VMAAALSVTGGKRQGSEERGGRGSARRQRRVIRTVFVVVVFAVVLVGIKPVVERFSFAALTGDVRPVYFRNTVEIIKDFPFLGTGLGTYLYAYPAYETTFRRELLEHAHNDYLELLAEAGIVGGGLLIFVAFGALGVLFARWARRNDHFVRGVGIGCLAGIAAMLIHSLTDFNLHITANAVLFVSLYALAGRVVALRREQN
jgi:O-antigen ligase